MEITKLTLKDAIDEKVDQLSKMQLFLLFMPLSSEDYNVISEKIGELKEYMINCESYNN